MDRVGKDRPWWRPRENPAAARAVPVAAGGPLCWIRVCVDPQAGIGPICVRPVVYNLQQTFSSSRDEVLAGSKSTRTHITYQRCVVLV